MVRQQAKTARAAVAQPLYDQVRNLVIERIRGGQWAAGDALPNEFSLAAEFGVSIGTVRRAVEGLERIGLLMRKQGRGTFVAAPGRRALACKLDRVQIASGEHRSWSFTLRRIERRSAMPAEAARLQLDMSGAVYDIEQTVAIGSRILGVERSTVPADPFPRLETQMTFGQNIYAVLADYGAIVTSAIDRVQMGSGDAAVAALLGISHGIPLLKLERLASALDRRAVEWRIAHYVACEVCYLGEL